MAKHTEKKLLPIIRRVAPWIIIVALVVFASLMKINHWRARGERLFYTDAAFRYRYAAMIASNTAIPEIDYAAQYPEGLHLRNTIFLTQEIVIGTAYKLFFGTSEALPFDRFLIIFLCTFSSLSIIAAFLMGWALWGNRWGGTVAALFYAVATPTFERTLGNYLREDFVLPFIFLALAAFIWGVTGRGKKEKGWQPLVLGILAGTGLAVALISWHLSQFVVTLLVLFCALFVLLRKRTDDIVIMPRLAVVIIFAAAVGIAHPVLRAKAFLFSYPMIAGYALIIAYYLDRRFQVGRLRRFILFAAALSGLLAVGLLVPRHAEEFSHVYSLFLAKLRFLGRKPADPGLLSFDARAFWLSPFLGPPLISILFSYIALLPLAAVPLGMRGYELRQKMKSKRHESTQSESEILSYLFLLYWTLVTFGLYLFAHRLSVFFVFFAVVAVAGWLSVFARTTLRWAPLLLIPFFLFEAHKDLTYTSRRPFYGFLARTLRPEPQSAYSWYGEIIPPTLGWIRYNTKNDDVIFTLFPTGSVVLTYAERPIVINSMFESSHMRKKVEECTRAYFESESELLEVCRRYEADYLLYDARILFGHGPNSLRYIAGETQATTTMAAYRLHFAPDHLDHFVPLYQNNYFRIFKVVQPGEEAPAPRQLTYTPLYDRELFGAIVGRGGIIDDAAFDAALARLQQALYYFQYGMGLLNTGLIESARPHFEASLALIPSFEPAHTSLAYIYQEAREWDDAIEHYRVALRLSPDDTFARYNLARMLYTRKSLPDSAVYHFKKVLEYDPLHTKSRNDLAYISWAMGDTATAIELYESVLAIAPDDTMALWALGELRGSGGQ